MTLFDLLGYHIKANPKYGSEKKGQPTTYYLSAAPEPIRVNCEYFYVDVVLSPDPNVFHHTNALAGLNEGGVFIIQSERTAPEKVWEDIPPAFQKIIADKKIKLFALDGFKIAREEATDSDLQLRMQGIAFQGAFFKASNVMQQAGLDEPRLLDAIRSQLQHKFGSKGARVVEDNMRVVKRGFDELIPVQPGAIGAGRAATQLRRSAGCAGHGQAVAREQSADERHPPILGADRQLRPWNGQRQHHRSLHRARRDARRLSPFSRHDADPLPASAVGP
ncbi:MAG: 2-oxoacid:acceptor oxidoreductase family protein [Bryobacterales bacterium]